MKTRRIIKEIICDDNGVCDPDCDVCSNSAGDAQWIVYDRDAGEYIQGPECIAAEDELKQLVNENQNHRDFINEESEELTEALEKVGLLKELIEAMISLAFPKKVVYTAERAGQMIALKERALNAIKEDI